MWLPIAFLNPILHSVSNVLDSYLTNRLFKKKTTIIFYAALINLFFLPPVFLFAGLPSMPTSASIGLLVGLAAINVLYMYPYYKALEQGDTSNVVALFSLSQLFVPLLAFIFVKEVLSPVQYLGVLLIMIGSVALSLQKGKRIPLNAAFWWMLLCAFILSFEYVLYKLAFASVNWVTGFTWPVLLTFVFAVFLLAYTNTRKDILENWPLFKKRIVFFGVEEGTTFLGIAASTYALSVAPVTLVKAIISTEPAFVLLLALLFSRRFPDFFRERVDYRSVRNKILLFVVIGAGLLLALDPSFF